jgi:hypothetical protein
MRIVDGVDLEISLQALKKLDEEKNVDKQENKFYNSIFAVGNTVSVYISGCPALILCNVTVKQPTESVFGDLRELVNKGETESLTLKLNFINDQSGFSGSSILKMGF